VKLQKMPAEEENVSGTYLLSLSMLGPVCFLLGLMSTLLKCAPHFWPIIVVSTLGFFLTALWKKSGLILSFFVLVCALGTSIRGHELFWPVFFSISVAISWLLLFLGHKEARFLIQAREKTLAALKEMNTEALAQVARLEAGSSRLQSEMASSMEDFKDQLHTVQSHLASAQSKCEHLEKQNDNWQQKHEQLLLEISSYQRKEKAFQHALEDAQNQLLKCKYAETEEKLETIEEKSFQALQAQHALLKEQFEEKSEVLHQMRKALFEMESQYLTLHRENEEKACSFSQEDAVLADHIQIMHELENEVHSLEELVSVLLSLVKKTSSPRKSKNKKEAQEDLFLMMNQTVSTS
jgi:hypothetical protein